MDTKTKLGLDLRGVKGLDGKDLVHNDILSLHSMVSNLLVEDRPRWNEDHIWLFFRAIILMVTSWFGDMPLQMFIQQDLIIIGSFLTR